MRAALDGGIILTVTGVIATGWGVLGLAERLPMGLPDTTYR